MDKRFFERLRGKHPFPQAGLKPYRSSQFILDRYREMLSTLLLAKEALESHDERLQLKALKLTIDLLNEVRYSEKPSLTDGLPYNIDHLYDHMQRRLLESHTHKNQNALNEVIELISILQSGFETVNGSFFDKS